jgi:hypothetical protein
VLQQVDLLLLPVNGSIEFLDHILGEVQFYFELGQTIFHGVSLHPAGGQARTRRRL